MEIEKEVSLTSGCLLGIGQSTRATRMTNVSHFMWDVGIMELNDDDDHCYKYYYIWFLRKDTPPQWVDGISKRPIGVSSSEETLCQILMVWWYIMVAIWVNSCEWLKCR